MAQPHSPETRWRVFRSLSGFRPSDLPSDMVAGLTLAAIAIPEQMATARLGGFSPQIGFFAFIAGSLGFAMFGSNRFLSCGADSTITPIFAGGLALWGVAGSPAYAGMAAALSNFGRKVAGRTSPRLPPHGLKRPSFASDARYSLSRNEVIGTGEGRENRWLSISL